MSYSYLSTLRLLDNGSTLAVGPNRRVVFRQRITRPLGHQDSPVRKDEIKYVLSPLRSFWGEDDVEKLRGRERNPDRPLMTFLQFKTAAKRLLTDAGMLRTAETKD